jgi:ATP-dependent RNA helicase RhlE
MGHPAAEIHSDRSLNQRREALDGFKTGKYRVLIATDIAARGIDVKGIELVVNYDLPSQPEDYVHRIGRTGRAGMEGRAISFAMPDQGKEVRTIEKLTRVYLPAKPLPELPPAPRREHEPPKPFHPSGPPRHRHGPRGRRRRGPGGGAGFGGRRIRVHY